MINMRKMMHVNRFEGELAESFDGKRQEYRPISFPTEHLSRFVDLRKYMSPIEEQGDMNTCSANAVAGICEYLLKRYTGRHYDVSRLFIYYNGQIISQRTRRVQDDGVRQRDIILGMRKYGLCEEKYWPYEERFLNVEPSSDVYHHASRYTVVPLRIPCDIKSIEACLNRQIPVLLDLVLIEHMGSLIKANQGYLPMPDLNNTSIDRTGIHTVLLVGYDRDTKHFIVRNSWGGDWGYGGYFFMPYAYLSHRRLFDPHDGLWTIIDIVRRENKLPTVRQLVPSNHRH